MGVTVGSGFQPAMVRAHSRATGGSHNERCSRGRNSRHYQQIRGRHARFQPLPDALLRAVIDAAIGNWR
jgi:hypothetical protein